MRAIEAYVTLHCQFASTSHPDADLAVGELARSLDQPQPACVLVFCSPDYHLPTLGSALRRAFACPVLACTTAGQLGPHGFVHGGMTAVSLASERLVVRPYLIEPLSECETRTILVTERIRLDNARRPAGWRSFGVLLADGLSLMEERLAATLFHALEELPIVGGSAGDELRFQHTHVYWDGEMRTDAAVFAVFDTDLPFATFHVHDVVPTPKQVVITAADTRHRLVHELDGLPAAEVYARLVGLPVEGLTAAVFARHPLLLSLGGATYPRSPSAVEPDLSLRFHCAVQEGLVLSIGDAGDATSVVRRLGEVLATQVTRPEVVLAFDCILRRLVLDRAGTTEQVGRLLAEQRVIGFSTYGEQFNAMHINHAFIGVALGSRS